MLENYFVKPTTIDQIRDSWLAESIEQYAAWMEKREYSPRSFHHRIPLIRRFGTFAWRRGARHLRQLPRLVDTFVKHESRKRSFTLRSVTSRRTYERDIRHPIQQMLRVAGHIPDIKIKSKPFENWAPDYFSYLSQERGLRGPTIGLYLF